MTHALLVRAVVRVARSHRLKTSLAKMFFCRVIESDGVIFEKHLEEDISQFAGLEG